MLLLFCINLGFIPSFFIDWIGIPLLEKDSTLPEGPTGLSSDMYQMSKCEEISKLLRKENTDKANIFLTKNIVMINRCFIFLAIL